MKSRAPYIKFISLFLLFFIILLACDKEEYINNISPVCKITLPTTDQEIIKGEIIKVKVDAYDEDGIITEVKFFIDNIQKASSVSPPYVFDWNTNGVNVSDHRIKAYSYDDSGLKDTDEIKVEVLDNGEPRKPEALYTNDVASGIIPFKVQFTDQSKYIPTSWHWDFGDHNTSSLQNPSHTYGNSGVFTVSLKVSNEYGSDVIRKVDSIFVATGGGGESCQGVPTVSDFDGNVYKTIQIGEQCWMKGNLNVGKQKSTQFDMDNNGIIEKYCYDNDSINCDIYGGLYQWNEMMQYSNEPGTQGICPNGWHVPTDDNWKELVLHLGPADAGGQMKEEGFIHWLYPNTMASNASGFTALAAGYRLVHGTSTAVRESALFWSSNTRNTQGLYRGLFYLNPGVYRYAFDKEYGFSVRCLMD